jgi:hypothetical protein
VILVNGQRVAVGDGIAAIDEPELTITAEENAEFILVEAGSHTGRRNKTLWTLPAIFRS